MLKQWMRVGLAAAGAVNCLALMAHGDVGYPSGTQDFESMDVGDSVENGDLPPWFTVNDSGPLFTVTGEDDVLGVVGPRGSSFRWLRIDDQDGGAVQNRFYSGNIVAPSVQNYLWTWYVNVEATPPAAPAFPRFTIQHLDGPFQNAWGIEFTSTGARLIVTGIGGVAASTPLYALGSPTGIGDWVKIDLLVNFMTNTVSASANNGAPVSLPINISATADKKQFRFCYRGENAGNVNRMLLDDVRVAVGDNAAVPAVSEWGLAVLLLLGLTLGSVTFGWSRTRRTAA